MATGKISGREFKKKVLELVSSNDFEQDLVALCNLPARKVINPLFSFLLSTDSKIKWATVTAFGAVVSNLAEQDMESARVIMRRLMWQLNDESGGIGWGCPEAIGEIIACHEGLAREYARVPISYIRVGSGCCSTSAAFPGSPGCHTQGIDCVGPWTAGCKRGAFTN
jgi:hypothetical protein